MKWFLCIILLLVLFIIYMIIEHMVIALRRQAIHIPELPEKFDGMKILHISDLHHREFGENQRKITDKAAALQPDIIVITGDLVSRDERDFSSVSVFCAELAMIAPVYFSMGNHELDMPQSVQCEYLDMLRKAGVRVLLDEVDVVSQDGSDLAIAGASLDISVYHGENFSYSSLNPYSASELNDTIGVHERCTILLAHNPLIFDAYVSWGAELVLSGHVHGGAVRLPFIGGLLSPERKFFPRYTKGLYNMGNSQLYVSAGLGKIRLFNPPEICLLTLRR